MRIFLFLLLFSRFAFGAVTHILMVRHGQTDRNAAGQQIQGWADDGPSQLNAQGHLQADTLGHLLAQRYTGTLSAIYTSPLGRCAQTAAHIAAYFPGIPLVEDVRFREICHGQHDLMSFEERNRFCLSRYVELAAEHSVDRFWKWRYNPLVEREVAAQGFPGTLETILQLYERVCAGILDLARNHPAETILISTHAAVIRTLSDEAEYRQHGDQSPLPVYYEPARPTHFKTEFFPGNCSIYHFIVKDEIIIFLGTES